MMQSVKILLFALLVVALAACSRQPAMKDINGNVIKFSVNKGKWIVLNYWASWCKPCYQEVPALNAFAKRYHNQAMVLGVSYDRVSTEELIPLAAKLGVMFPTLASDPAGWLGIDNVPGLPATYIVGPDGKLRQRLLGIQTEASLASAIGQG